MLRDIKERGRSIEGVLKQYNMHVKKAYDEFIKPTMKYADIVIPYGRENEVAIDFVVENIKTRLKAMGIPLKKKLLWQTKLCEIPGKEAPLKMENVTICCENDESGYDVLNKMLTEDEIMFRR